MQADPFYRNLATGAVAAAAVSAMGGSDPSVIAAFGLLGGWFCHLATTDLEDTQEQAPVPVQGPVQAGPGDPVAERIKAVALDSELVMLHINDRFHWEGGRDDLGGHVSGCQVCREAEWNSRPGLESKASMRY